MAYIIDGHNLVPKIPGLSLRNLDDETQLIDLLVAFCRAAHTSVEVYFDGAPITSPPSVKSGPVTAYFVRKGTAADEAIIARTLRLGKAARNWKVVSSDHHVQVNARAAGTVILPSEEFAKLLAETLSRKPGVEGEPQSSPAEVQAWLEIFGRKPKG